MILFIIFLLTLAFIWLLARIIPQSFVPVRTASSRSVMGKWSPGVGSKRKRGRAAGCRCNGNGSRQHLMSASDSTKTSGYSSLSYSSHYLDDLESSHPHEGQLVRVATQKLLLTTTSMSSSSLTQALSSSSASPSTVDYCDEEHHNDTITINDIEEGGGATGGFVACDYGYFMFID